MEAPATPQMLAAASEGLCVDVAQEAVAPRCELGQHVCTPQLKRSVDVFDDSASPSSAVPVKRRFTRKQTD
eukprot:8536622-Prorocentrum_lima.AAC.2